MSERIETTAGSRLRSRLPVPTRQATSREQAVARHNSADRTRSLARDVELNATAGEEIIWEPWNTVAGVAMTTGSDYDFIQPEANWLDLADESRINVRLDLLQITALGGAAGGVTFQLQTAVDVSGPWEEVASFTAMTSTSFVAASDESAVFGLARYLRYRVASINDPWAVSFQINVSTDSASRRATRVAVPADDYIEVQPWIAFQSTAEATDPTEIVQDASDWLATTGMRYLALETEMTILSGATLHLQSSYVKEGPWSDIATYTAAYSVQQVALSWEDNSDSGGEAPLGRFIRWQLEGSKGGGAFWVACFRINGKWT